VVIVVAESQDARRLSRSHSLPELLWIVDVCIALQARPTLQHRIDASGRRSVVHRTLAVLKERCQRESFVGAARWMAYEIERAALAVRETDAWTRRFACVFGSARVLGRSLPYETPSLDAAGALHRDFVTHEVRATARRHAKRRAEQNVISHFGRNYQPRTTS